jgi:hypothetical protein
MTVEMSLTSLQRRTKVADGRATPQRNPAPAAGHNPNSPKPDFFRSLVGLFRLLFSYERHCRTDERQRVYQRCCGPEI